MAEETAALTEKEIVEGAPIEFEIEGRTFYMRQPTTEEYDDAQTLQQMHDGLWRAKPEMQEAAQAPCSEAERMTFLLGIRALEQQIESLKDDEQDKADLIRSRIAGLHRQLDGRTLADELVGERALLARDRALTRMLLVDANQKPLFPPGKAGDAAWAKFPLRAKDACRRQVWRVMRAVEEAPFV